MTPTRTTVARRNPRARPAPKHPTVVLVRRFDPAGEELAQWEPLYRDDEGVTFFSPTAAKAAALNPPRDADLHVGDLIVTVPAEAVTAIEEYATGLYVVTPDGVKAAPKPPEDLGGPWLATWGRNAYTMLLASAGVDRRRLVLASCDCAETVLHFVPAGEDRPRRALDVARAWCFGEASTEDTQKAAEAAVGAYYTVGKAGYSAYDAASSAYVRSAGAASAAAFAVSEAGEAAHEFNGTPYTDTFREMAPLVERWIPLPVALLSRLGYPQAIPFDPSTVPAGPRENPRSRSGRRGRR